MEKEILYRVLVASNRGETYLSYGFAEDEIAEVKKKFERLYEADNKFVLEEFIFDNFKGFSFTGLHDSGVEYVVIVHD